MTVKSKPFHIKLKAQVNFNFNFNSLFYFSPHIETIICPFTRKQHYEKISALKLQKLDKALFFFTLKTHYISPFSSMTI